MRRFVLVAVLAVALVGSSCSSGDSSDGGSGGGADDSTSDVQAQPAGTAECDAIDPSACLMPWPNDRFTRVDPSTATGRRVDLPVDGTPQNASGTPIDPAEWNRNDGFAPASTLLTVVPGVDPLASNLPPVTDIGASLDDDSGLVLVDADTGERVAAWAELDANADDPERQALMIVPAAALLEGHRYSVGLRGLVDGDGAPIEPSAAFADAMADPDESLAQTLDDLAAQGASDGDELVIAWSFTVGSGDDISGRLRHMWDEARDEVGDGAPAFEVTSTEDSGAARIVRGTFEVPNYLQGDGGPGSFMNNDGEADGLPEVNGDMEVTFTCTVPAGATPDAPAASVIYGHGLLGSQAEVLGLGLVGASVNLNFCALDWLGMSTNDIGTIIASFDDLSSFRSLPDRLQQGHLSFLLLGRLLRSSEGFVTDPAFQDADGAAVLDTESLSLLGASQGGILGGVSSSLTNDWSQVVLGVPGMGYNLLLRRSVDFDEFFPAVEANYPDELGQSLVLDLLEQLWQRGENAGYAQHLTSDPYDGVEPNQVLLLEAFGDHQVANVSTEKLARTLGIGRRAPTLADGRSTDAEPFWGIPEIDDLATAGSGLFVWDFGTEAPPTENLPNRAGDDPHGELAGVPEALALVLGFSTGDRQLSEVCGTGPCTSGG